MSTLRFAGSMLKNFSHVQQTVKMFSTSLVCQNSRKYAPRHDRFEMEHNRRPDEVLQEKADSAQRNPRNMNFGYPRGQAHRIPYKRPVILKWETYTEIPYHYREGKNKKMLIPEMKKKKIKKYKNHWEERPHYRSKFQRLMNKAKSLIPYDKKICAITGKHTGPGVDGGTELAQRLAALHLVQPTGYVNKIGNFTMVKEMVPELVVPKLDDFKLRPYVPYRATDINQSKFTARSLYNSFYASEAEQKFEEETGAKPANRVAKDTKKSLLSKWLPKKKDS